MSTFHFSIFNLKKNNPKVGCDHNGLKPVW